MFTKHNNKPRSNHSPLERESNVRSNHSPLESLSNARSNHSPLEGESQSQLVGDAVRGQKLIAKSNTQLNPNSFVPSPKTSSSTLPQGQGDNSELDKVDNAESEANDKSKILYSQKKLQFAKNLRHSQTDAEGLCGIARLSQNQPNSL